MKPCKYLDYEAGKFRNCELITIEGGADIIRYWKRGEIWTEGGNPEKVQFCKRKGRINSVSACYTGESGDCYDPE